MITQNEVIIKKRGRKPKNKLLIKNTENIENINSEDEKIILHLPITINDINNDIFIYDKDIENNNNTEDNYYSSDDDIITTINQHYFINNNINKIMTYDIKIDKNTKCWWCKNNFENQSIQLPELFFDNNFYCIGNFCSFNCAKSYNFELKDSMVSKRDSLLNLLYYYMYNEYKEIIKAPHWLSLEEFGGNINIKDFRENNIKNLKNYIILNPPIISRQIIIEESCKKNKNSSNSIDILNKKKSVLEPTIEKIIH